MRVHTNLAYGRLRYRVLGDVTQDAVRLVSLQLETPDGKLVSVPLTWTRTLSLGARHAIEDALLEALDAYQTRFQALTVIEGGRSSIK